MKMFDVFDGHNDVLLRLWMKGNALKKDGKANSQLYCEGFDAHIDHGKAKEGGLKGGFFAMFVPQQNSSGDAILGTDPIAQRDAETVTEAMFTILENLARDFPQDIAICTSHDEITSAMGRGVMACLPHIEGAEAIKPDLSIWRLIMNAAYDRLARYGHALMLSGLAFLLASPDHLIKEKG